jgi:ribonuclease HII
MSGINYLAGVDEAGRGPLAGPVVSAAVIFHNGTFIDGINDSKKVSEKERYRLAKIIKKEALCYAYGIIDQFLIDKLNILRATIKSMEGAVENLPVQPELILIDGNKTFISNTPIKAIVKGDSKSFCIAAASILAKVKRDEIMEDAALLYPQYSWQNNKGYATKQHINAIRKYGYTKLHRKSFLKKILLREYNGNLLNK